MKNKEIWEIWERITAKFFLEKWYKFLKKNYYQKNFWEIDLIFKNWKELIFIEVKTRTNLKFWEWFEHISDSKLRKLAKTWELFCLKNWYNFENCRFDVVSILLELNWEIVWKTCKIKHFEKVL